MHNFDLKRSNCKKIDVNNDCASENFRPYLKQIRVTVIE